MLVDLAGHVSVTCACWSGAKPAMPAKFARLRLPQQEKAYLDDNGEPLVLLTGVAIHLLSVAPSLKVSTSNVGDHIIRYADFVSIGRTHDERASVVERVSVVGKVSVVGRVSSQDVLTGAHVLTAGSVRRGGHVQLRRGGHVNRGHIYLIY